MAQELRIEGYRSGKKPDMRPLVRYWADMILQAVDESGKFRDPEMEEEFQEWMKAQDAGKAETA